MTFRNPHGYGVIIGDPAHSFGIAEHDAVTCIHCGHIDMVRPSAGGPLQVMVFRRDGTHYFKDAGFCRSCMQPICPKCDGKPCNNRFRRMEREEAAARKVNHA